MNSIPSENKERHILLLYHNQVQVIQLQSRLTSLGRDRTKDIAIHCDKISREHATFLQIPGSEPGRYEYRIIDGGPNNNRSKHGLSINGKNAYLHRLEHGDLICFSRKIEGLYLKVSLNDKDFKTYIKIMKRVQTLNERTRNKILLMTRIFDKVTSYLESGEEKMQSLAPLDALSQPLEPAV